MLTAAKAMHCSTPTAATAYNNGMARRRRKRSTTFGPGAGSVLLPSSRSSPRRRRRSPSLGGGGRGRGLPWRALAGLLVVAAIVAGGLMWRARAQARDDRHAAAARFVAAWEHGDRAAMWRTLTPAARAAYDEQAFAAAYRAAYRAAGVKSVRAGGKVPAEAGGRVKVTVTIDLRDFADLRGTIALPVSGTGAGAGVDWQPALRLPGLRRGEPVRRRAGRQPQRREILTADGRPLNGTALGASVAGVVDPSPTGLERAYDERLSGHPSASLLFGSRVVATTRAVRGRSVHTTLRPGLMRAANDRARIEGRRHRRDPPERRRAARPCGPRGVRAPAAGVDVQDHHHRRGARARRRDPATRTIPGDVRDAVGGQARQRRRRALRRHADAGIRRVLQLGLRPARREGRREADGRRRESVRLR